MLTATTPKAFIAQAAQVVNSTTGGDQLDPHVAALADGGIVVVWTQWAAAASTFSDFAVHAQRFDSAGAKTGGEQQLHIGATADAAAGLLDGGFAIAMSTLGGNVRHVLARKFDAAGAAAGPVQTVFSGGTSDSLMLARADDIDALPDGGYLVTGRISDPRPPPEEGYYVRRFGTGGSPAGEPLLVARTFGNGLPVSTSVLSNGGWVTAWQEIFSPRAPRPPSNIQAFAKVFDASHALVASVNINPNPDADEYAPSTATLKSGRYVLAWAVRAFTAGSALPRVQLQMFDHPGPTTGVVGLNAPEVIAGPQLTSLADGGFLLSLATPLPGHDTVSVLGQYYDADAHASGPMFELGAARRPGTSRKSFGSTWSVAPTPSGGFVFASQMPTASSGEDIYLRRFAPMGN